MSQNNNPGDLSSSGLNTKGQKIDIMEFCGEEREKGEESFSEG
jgi:hypothetical protein